MRKTPEGDFIYKHLNQGILGEIIKFAPPIQYYSRLVGPGSYPSAKPMTCASTFHCYPLVNHVSSR